MGLFSSKESKLIVVGLDNSGKSTMIQRMKPQKQAQEDIAPTVGFNVENFKKNNINFTLMDMSGQQKYREMWSKYIKNVDGIIFVIDSADKLRNQVLVHELDTLMSEPDIKSKPIPILFFANKMDLPNAQGPNDYVELLDLGSISDRTWHIEATNALTGTGVDEGLKWLTDQLTKK